MAKQHEKLLKQKARLEGNCDLMERRLAAMEREAEEGEENAKVAARYEVTKRNQEDIERMLKKIASLEQDLQLRDESISDLSRQLKQANSQLQSQSLLHKPGTSMKTSSQDFTAQNYDISNPLL